MTQSWNVGNVGRDIRNGSMPVPVADDGPSNYLSPRQQELDYLWRHYRCSQYEGRKFDWDGRENVGHIEHDIIAHTGNIPPGFYDAGAALIPLKFRKPSTVYNLPKVIVNRFTSLLFSSKRHPQIDADDPDTADWLNGFAEATRLWAAMITARTMGGAMGSVGLGFKFVRGKPFVELHDPRWCTPIFEDRGSMVVKSFEKLYQYPVAVRTKDGWEDQWFWYRRVIDSASDTVWPKVPVHANEDPDWESESSKSVEHNFGFCPTVWIQNQPVEDDIDGDSDFHGALGLCERIDALWSQADRGTLANCLGVETKFITSTGVRSFADCKDGEHVVVLTHLGCWKPAIVKSFGEQQLFEFTFQRGPKGAPVSIRATENHRWLLDDGTETETLQVGDKVKAAPNVFTFEFKQASDEAKLWWCWGFIWGDGPKLCKTESRVRLYGKKAKYIDRFFECGFEVQTPKSFAPDPVMISKTVPKSLPSDLPWERMQAFVRGYLDANAAVGKKRSSRWRCIQATGEASIEFIRKYFPMAGVYISHEFEVAGGTNYGPRKSKTIRFQLNENRSSYSNSVWRVVSKEPLSTETVWCLQVEDAHSFILPQGMVCLNCDPTVGIASDASFEEIKKGSGNALQVERGGSINYLEMTGTGIDRAMVLAEKLEERALTVARCMLDRNEGGPSRTAEEVEHNYSSMIEQADIYREQYGEKGVKLLLEMVLAAAKTMSNPTIDKSDPETPKIVRSTITLPKRKILGSEGDIIGFEERKLGNGSQLELTWPSYFEPSLEVTLKSVEAASTALASRLIDQAHATRFIAEYFHVKNRSEMLKSIDAETDRITAIFANNNLLDQKRK